MTQVGSTMMCEQAGPQQLEAGYTHIALVQVGGDTQERFITWAATDLLPALHAGRSDAHPN